MTTVREEWGMKCPKCNDDDFAVQTVIEAEAYLTPDGTDFDGDGDHEWDNESDIRCVSCGWEGKVAETKSGESRVETTDAPNQYTVLLLRPDDQWNGHQSDWVIREHVEAETVEEAFGIAQDRALDKDGDSRISEDFAVLAVYEGHLNDAFVA